MPADSSRTPVLTTAGEGVPFKTQPAPLGSNATALMGVLKGTKGPFRDIAIFNAAAALIVAGRAKDLKEGAALAAKSVDSGEAEGRLDRLIAVSNAPASAS